jgi:hypothetical protein
MEYHDVVSLEILAEKFCEEHPQECNNQPLKTSGEAKEVYMIEAIVRSQFRRYNWSHIGFQHVSYDGRTWRFGTA